MEKYVELTLDELYAECYRRGLLEYKFHAGQRVLFEKFTNSKRQLFVAECARQFGKSFFWVSVAIGFALQNPGSKIKYGTAYHSDLLEFIRPTFDAVLEDCPTDVRPTYRVSGSKFIFKNGSEIKLVGLDQNPNGLRGNVIDLIILDEAGFIDKLDYIYKSVIIPATTHRPSCRVALSSTPPSTPAHPFLDYVQKAMVENSHVLMTIYENPMVTTETIERLMAESGGEDSTTWKREYLCLHITDSDLAITPEWKDDFVIDVKRDELYPFYHKYVGMDLGVRDKTAAIFGHYDFKRASLIIESEYCIHGPKMTTEILQKQLKGKETELGWRKVYKRIADSNNPLLLQDLSLIHGLHFNATDKGTIEEMVNEVRMMLARGQILVDRSCTQLIGCLKYGVWEEKRNKFAHSNVFGHFDALAALIYLVRNLDKNTNPVPHDFMVDPTDNVIFKRERLSVAASELKKAFGG